jgi:hypothetical protein
MKPGQCNRLTADSLLISIRLGMSTEPQQSQHATRGVIHIVRQDRPNAAGNEWRRLDFSVSFGGKKDGVGAFYVGTAYGLDDLANLLAKAGVLQPAVDEALQVLGIQPKHEIPNVTLPKVFLRNLGL